DDLARLPGLVRVDAQVHLAAAAASHDTEAGDVILPRDTDLHLHLVKPVEAIPPRQEAQLQSACRGYDAAVAHFLFRFVELGVEQTRNARQGLPEMAPERVQDRQLDGAAGGVPLAAAYVLDDRREAHSFDHRQRVRPVA